MTTAVIQIAGVGILPNPPADVGVALQKPANLTTSLNSYNAIDTVTSMGNIITLAATEAKVGNISFTEFQTIASIGQNTFPVLTNVLSNNISVANAVTALNVYNWEAGVNYNTGDYVTYNSVLYNATFNSRGDTPSSNTGSDGNASPWAVDTGTYKLATAIDNQAGNIISEADNTKFTQVYYSFISYMDSLNARINTNNNANLLSSSFSAANGGMNYVTTGAVNVVTNNFIAFATDLLKTGNLIGFNNIDNFGFPSQILVQISATTGRRVPELNALMLATGFDQVTINSVSAGETLLTPAQEKSLYNILLGIDGSTLSAITSLLGVTTPNILVAADLLDLTLLFPNSYQTLLCVRTNEQLVPIYTSANTVNSLLEDQFKNDPIALYLGGNLQNSYQTLGTIMPRGDALAIKAFINSIKQIKNYQSVTALTLGTALLSVKDNSDLSLIAGLTQLIPPAVVTFYAEDLALGTGVGNTVILNDMFGTINDGNVVNCFGNATTFLTGIDSELVYVEAAMDTLYTELNVGNSITSAVANVNSEIVKITANNVSNVATLNTEFLTTANVLYRNIYNQRVADFEWGETISNDQQSAFSFSQELHEIGTDATYGTGDMITKALNNAGIDLDNEISESSL